MGQNNFFGITNENAKEILFSPPKIVKAFDQLAQKVDFYLDYPLLLIRDGVTGNASLDLYFDNDGLVDENNTVFSGSNRYVRGLLVKATRDGLVKWYETDGIHLNRDEFRNQHFQVDFEISYTEESISKYEKIVPNSYSFIRRHYRHECASPTGIDVACLAIKAYGVVDKAVSPEFKIKLATLKEHLEFYDNLGLNNLNQQISILKI